MEAYTITLFRVEVLWNSLISTWDSEHTCIVSAHTGCNTRTTMCGNFYKLCTKYSVSKYFGLPLQAAVCLKKAKDNQMNPLCSMLIFANVLKYEKQQQQTNKKTDF